MTVRGEPTAHCGEGEPCAVCADAGEVAEVVALDADELGRALVRRADGTEELVALDLVEVVTGERVLVHLGFAICKVGET